jgi:hypothetical protein
LAEGDPRSDLAPGGLPGAAQLINPGRNKSIERGQNDGRIAGRGG